MFDQLAKPTSAVSPPLCDPPLEDRARRLLRKRDVRRATDFLRRTDDRVILDQCELTAIPAPPFGEAKRARRMGELMAEVGLSDVGCDAEGNVLGVLASHSQGPALVVSAHLDTVFPAGTDVTVRHVGDRICGPGISDDARGLAALLALARTLTQSGPDLERPLLFVATVGEEGTGDLRGVRHLFRDDGPGRSGRGFISLDGAGTGRIVTRGLGSRRYRITARGPGGHSWVDWGTPNPIHMLGELVARATAMSLPQAPPTSLTVARWGGGTSVNAIPREAWVDLEVRSEGNDEIEGLDRAIRELGATTVVRVNEHRPKGTLPLELSVSSIGHRPAGETPPDSALVMAAAAATAALGSQPALSVSSTDANIPMTLGVPAVTMGAGGEAGQAHTTDEWYRNVGGTEGLVRALLTVLLMDEVP